MSIEETADESRGRTGSRAPWVRLAVAAGLMVAYWLLLRLPAPVVDYPALSGLPYSIGSLPSKLTAMSVVALGIKPFVTGFFLIGVLSFILPWWQGDWRSGTPGWQRLYRAALVASLLVCTIRSLYIALFPFGPYHLDIAATFLDEGWLAVLVLVLSLVAGSAALFYLCDLASKVGLGSGFALVLAWPYAQAALGAFRAYVLAHVTGSPFPTWSAHTPVGPPPPIGIIAFMPVVSTIFLGVMLVLKLRATRRGPGSGLVGLSLSRDLKALLRSPFGAGLLVLMLLLLFLAALEEPHLRRFALFQALGFAVVVVMLLLDLVNEWRFLSRHRDVVQLTELDETRRAMEVQALLTEQGVPVLAKSFHLRSLFRVFLAIVKIQVLVPTEHAAAAREALERAESAA